jgi:holo-[acyl-carrier protein] synthase
MMIRGIGLDMVTVSRFERMIDRYGDRLLNRLFCEDERRYCSRYAHPAQHYAARFAAKEAMLKALGVPKGLSWHDLEVVSESNRQPGVRLRGKAEQVARERGIARMFVSLTHEMDMAAAVVVAEGAE